MYYVLMTSQTWRDSNVPSIAPRMVDEDPLKVLETARKILNSAENSDEWKWVEKIFIYAMELGRFYSIWNASSLPHVNEESVHTVAYVGWWTQGRIHENFRTDFADKCGHVTGAENQID